ncbi:hypothetical protein L1987_44536 [Smallanthus sonchifolius]|uniref:Uncharacterized protein n=1 Tax=Smallanthus sonchifolius TaxID=185202 RepID=A0ACB9GQS7_9ASTR|nr:hypothetical protein L1987_44536 [Smallanthus sonchifolius]
MMDIDKTPTHVAFTIETDVKMRDAPVTENGAQETGDNHVQMEADVKKAVEKSVKCLASKRDRVRNQIRVVAPCEKEVVAACLSFSFYGRAPPPLRAVLWLGNVTFSVVDNENHVESVIDEALLNISKLIGCEADGLKLALSTRKMKVGNDNIVQKLTLAQAIDTTDVLAKSIYSCLFDWNIFKMALTGQKWNLKTIKTLNLIEKKPLGLLTILDEESTFPNGTDLTFAVKLKQHITSDSCFRGERGKSFTVHHYAVEVKGLVIMHNQIWGFLWPNATAAFMENKVMVSLLSPVLGYLTAGILIGPYGLSIIHNVHATKPIAEFGVVFLVFNISLEVSRLKSNSSLSLVVAYVYEETVQSVQLSLERLSSMKKYDFGLGSVQCSDKPEA